MSVWNSSKGIDSSRLLVKMWIRKGEIESRFWIRELIERRMTSTPGGKVHVWVLRGVLQRGQLSSIRQRSVCSRGTLQPGCLSNYFYEGCSLEIHSSTTLIVVHRTHANRPLHFVSSEPYTSARQFGPNLDSCPFPLQNWHSARILAGSRHCQAVLQHANDDESVQFIPASFCAILTLLLVGLILHPTKG